MDLLYMNVLRPTAQISPIFSSQRFSSTPAPSTSCSLSSSLSRIGRSRLVNSKQLRSSPTNCKSIFHVRASQSNDDEAEEISPENESFFIQEEAINLDPELRKGVTDFSSAGATTNTENQLTQEQLQEILSTLSQSLAVLSASLSEVSSAVRVLSATLSTQQQRNPDSDPMASEVQYQAARTDGAFTLPEQPEPWPPTQGPSTPTRNVHETEDDKETDNSVPDHLVEENRVAHKLAYRLQQAFVQARIEGLGKPFQVAVEDFADTCMEAHSLGIGLKELQLQLILQDGSLTGAFALRNQRFSNDPIFNETSRVRSLWVRLVYSTLAELEEREKPAQTEEPTEEITVTELDGTDTFVKQVIKLCIEDGYDLHRIKLEQNFAGETTSPSIKAMRQNQYLILLVVDKVQKRRQQQG